MLGSVKTFGECRRIFVLSIASKADSRLGAGLDHLQGKGGQTLDLAGNGIPKVEYTHLMNSIPVVPHKAVAEVSKIGNL